MRNNQEPEKDEIVTFANTHKRGKFPNRICEFFGILKYVALNFRIRELQTVRSAFVWSGIIYLAINGGEI